MKDWQAKRPELFKQIEAVAMDMNASFDLEAKAQCPNAEVENSGDSIGTTKLYSVTIGAGLPLLTRGDIPSPSTRLCLIDCRALQGSDFFCLSPPPR